MGRSGSDMGTDEIDSTARDIELPDESRQLAEELAAASGKLDDLPFISIHSVGRRAGDIDAALRNTYRLGEEHFTLAPPVDWWHEPYQRPGERAFLQNSFVFADPLLADARFGEVLVPLAAIFADWLGANPRSGSPHPHRYAWHDHAAAGRVVTMAFVLREGVRRGLLDRAMAQTLASGVLQHVQYLLAEENYAAHNNHGFASDAAVTLAARSLAPASQTKAWAEVAARRFAQVLDHMIDREEAIHLEHSPYYHWIIQGALARFAAGGLFEGLDLVGLTRRMEEAGAWLVAPDGTLPPIGDTPMGQRPPRSALATSATRTGMKVFPAAGYAVIRAADSALIVTAAHHPTAHKHADDGSFCLYERGRPIILDSGNPGYEYDSSEFRYGTSPAAHATICVDGFNWARGAPPYGSGIVGATEGGSLYALLTRNPHAVPGGGAARRVFVYAPAQFLLVIDDVEAGGDHRLSRHLPLAPGLMARLSRPGGVEIADGDSTIAHLLQLTTAKTAVDSVDIACGQDQPELRGVRFLTPEEPCASCDVTLSGPAGQPRAYMLRFGPLDADRPPAMTCNRSNDRLDVTVNGVMASTLEIRVGEDSLTLEPGATG
jgi:Heparinase II/III-like protein